MPEGLLSNMLGSAMAGIVSRVCTHPLDTAKARLQAIYAGSATSYRGPVDVLVKTFRSEGISGMYRGFGAVVVGGTPGTMLYLISYDLAKDQLSLATERRTSGTSMATDFAVHFSSGMIAEAVACIVYVPVDVIKERLQVQHSTDTQSYKGSWDACKTIARAEGIPALYRGYAATLISFGSYSGLFFLLYEQLLAQVRETRLRDTDVHSAVSSSNRSNIPFHWTLLCSCSAGAAASWLTSPLDMAKLRLQVQRGQQHMGEGNSGNVVYRGVWDCLVHSYRHGGGKGLFRGAGARVLHFAPATTVTITSYEVCRSFIAKNYFVD